MESSELNHNKDCTGETSADHLISLDCPRETDIYGDPSVPPRIGDQYQVELPPLKTEAEHLQLIQRSTDAEGPVGVEYDIRMGLAIPIIWVPNQSHVVKDGIKNLSETEIGASKSGPMSFRNTERNQNSHNVAANVHVAESSNTNGQFPISACKVEPVDREFNSDEVYTNLKSHEYSPIIDAKDTELHHAKQKKSAGYTPVPGLQSISWTDTEIENFMLGLYIFGKNLVQVRKFMGSKRMGDILTFYYGKFYKSGAHSRWSDCRKNKSRRCIHGQRIFTGWRQQELLSRLLPSISEENQHTLLKVTKNFNEGGTSLVNLVFDLKDIVGMKALVEAIGIGKGKHDLTGVTLDHVRASQAFSNNSEIPVGKACSSLTSGEIIKFLTGNFRLSKARANDLFWEAVWPRLLAKGWHSEQPKDQNCATSKHTLVFLIPGVKKFSRRKLVKGEHYYDSVSDVLNKVASDPRLLELNTEGAKGNSGIDGEYEEGPDTKLDQNGSPDQRHCYLRPKLLNFTSDLVKFTVVDTSLVQGEAPFKVRELRSLPADNTCSFARPSSSDETDSNSSQVHLDSGVASQTIQESDPGISDGKKLEDNVTCTIPGLQSSLSANVHAVPKRKRPVSREDANGQFPDLLNEQVVKGIMQSEHSAHAHAVSKRKKSIKRQDANGQYPDLLNQHAVKDMMQRDHSAHIPTVSKRKNPLSRQDANRQYPDLLNEQPVKDPSCQFGRGEKSGKPNYLSPPSKRRRLTACSYSESAQSGVSSHSFSRAHRVKKETSSQSKPLGMSSLATELGPCQGKTSTAYSGKEGQIESGLCISRIQSVGASTVAETVVSDEKFKHRTLIDLNIPLPPDFDVSESLSRNQKDRQDVLNANRTFHPEKEQLPDNFQGTATIHGISTERQPPLKERRQSTRNRPPTTRALEALASGFLNTRQRRGSRAPSAASRSSRRARKAVEASPSVTTVNNGNVISEVSDSMTGGMDEECSSYANEGSLFSKSQVKLDNKGITYDFLGIP